MNDDDFDPDKEEPGVDWVSWACLVVAIVAVLFLFYLLFAEILRSVLFALLESL